MSIVVLLRSRYWNLDPLDSIKLVIVLLIVSAIISQIIRKLDEWDIGATTNTKDEA